MNGMNGMNGMNERNGIETYFRVFANIYIYPRIS